MLLKSITLSLAVALFMGCGSDSSGGPSEAAFETQTKTTSSSAEEEQAKEDESLLNSLISTANLSTSFNEFAFDALASITPQLIQTIFPEASEKFTAALNLLPVDALFDNDFIKDYLFSFYEKITSGRSAPSLAGDANNLTQEDRNFLSGLIESIKDKIREIINNGFKNFGDSDEPTVENPQVANQVQAVWNEVISDPLTTLPQEEISFLKLYSKFKDIILADAKRTIAEQSDIRHPFEKLAHPNGVCMKGTWKINTANPYSGYFKNESEALIIARASSAMSNTKKGENRAFGLAGKIFPTTDAHVINNEPTANFFVIDDLGGTKADYFTDVELTNEPKVSTTSEVLKYILYGLKVASAFNEADKNPGIRQVYEISHLGETNTSTIITPQWMKLEAQEGQTALNATDFRDEFSFETQEELRFNISVASSEVDGVKQWQTIGVITFNESVVSTSCDHRLHFHHPVWRDDLVYE
jgi:hypothetical protein